MVYRAHEAAVLPSNRRKMAVQWELLRRSAVAFRATAAPPGGRHRRRRRHPSMGRVRIGDWIYAGDRKKRH